MIAAVAPEPAVSVEGLVKRFGDFTAVDGISFSVAKGEIFGFLGPNGAGKSTTIRMLCGILRPTAGRGRVAGFDLWTETDRIKEHIGYMSQKFSLYADLTVEENIEFFADIYGVPSVLWEERKRWVLRMANLEERRRSLTGDLAAGWKQRLALGCAVIHQPRILFLDEPTAGVDPLSRRFFWELIDRMAAQGMTIFVTTHHMDEAEHCERIALIYRGRIAALGTPAKLKERSLGGTLLEVHARPLMAALDLLEAEPLAQDVAIFGAGLHVRTESPEAAGDLRAALERGGVGEIRIEPILPSLEDVFVALIEREDRKAEASAAARRRG